MNKIHNLKHYKPIRKKLRNSMTPAEVILWSKIKNKQLGYKFRRQQGIGKYIVDFYCPELRLVIEVDGSTHDSEEQINKDENRQKFLENIGLTVKRYTDTQVVKGLDNVIEDLQQTINELKELD